MFNVWQRYVTDESGDIIPNPEVEVRDEDSGDLVPLFSDVDGNTSLGNPFTGGSDGFAQFYVSAGRFKITVTKNTSTSTFRYVQLGSAGEDVVTSYETKAALEAARVPSFVDALYLLGYTNPGDDGGHHRKRVAISTSTTITSADGAHWEVAENKINVKMFGAKGDGSTDDASAVQDAIDYLSSGGALFFPRGNYLVSSTLNLTASDTVMEGETPSSGRSAWSNFPSRILWGGADNATMIEVDPSETGLVRGCGLRRLTLDGQQTTGVVAQEINENNAFTFAEDCTIRRIGQGFLARSGATGMWFRNVHVYDFDQWGWNLLDANHRTNFWGCKADNVNVTSANAVVRIGAGGGHSSNVNFYGCEFQAKGVPHMVDAWEVRNLVWMGGYMEAVDTFEPTQFIKLGNSGTTQGCDGVYISSYFQAGSGGGTSQIVLVDHMSSGVVLEGNDFRGTLANSVIRNNGGTTRSRFGANALNGLSVFSGAKLAEGFDHNNWCTIELADDAAIALEPPVTESAKVGVIDVWSSRQPTPYLKGLYDAQGASINMTNLISSGNAAFTTGTLNGTTGTDGDLTISAADDGKVYIENRLGQTNSIVYKFGAPFDS